MIAYIIGNFPSNYMIQKLGTKIPVCLGITCVIVGGWIKCLINYWFYWTIVGMFFVGIGLFLLLNCMVNISLDWFGPSERVMMTSFSNLISFGGIALGFFLPKIWIDNNEKDHEVSKDQIYNFLFYTAIMVSPGILAWVLYKNKPKTPPSTSACSLVRQNTLKKLK